MIADKFVNILNTTNASWSILPFEPTIIRSGETSSIIASPQVTCDKLFELNFPHSIAHKISILDIVFCNLSIFASNGSVPGSRFCELSKNRLPISWPKGALNISERIKVTIANRTREDLLIEAYIPVAILMK